MVSDRLQPHDIGAEESVIGSILIDGESIARVTSILRPTDFYSQRNRKCYEACLALYESNRAIDQVSVAYEISVEEGALEQIGGAEYLARLVSNVPTSIHIEHYANIVRGTSILRHVIRAGGEVSELGYDGGSDVEQVLDKAEEVVFGVRSGRNTKGFTPIRDYLDNYMEQTGALHDPTKISLAPVVTGFPSLDELLGGGLQRSDLIILAARPSLGKSTLALNMARNAAEQGFSTALFSLEMSGEQIAARLLASEANIDSHRLRMNLIREDEEVRVLDAVGLLSDLQIYVDDTPFQSVMEFRSKSRRLQQESGLDLLIVDYLQLVDVGRNDNRAVALGEVSRSLKGTCTRAGHSRNGVLTVEPSRSSKDRTTGRCCRTSGRAAVSSRTPTWCRSFTAKTNTQRARSGSASSPQNNIQRTLPKSSFPSTAMGRSGLYLYTSETT